MSEVSASHLRDRPFFIALDDAQIAQILSISTVRTFRAGEAVLREGDPGETLCVILEGLVEIRRGGRTIGALAGEDSRWAIEEGDFFGEMSLLDYQPRAASVVALTDVRLLDVPHEGLLDLWGRDREMQVVILTNMARILSRRLRRMND